MCDKLFEFQGPDFFVKIALSVNFYLFLDSICVHEQVDLFCLKLNGTYVMLYYTCSYVHIEIMYVEYS